MTNNQDSTKNNEAEGGQVIRFFYRYRKLYLAVLLFSIAGGAGVTLFMTPKYFSYAILFPAQNLSIESVVDNPVFGYDVEADRALQLLYSEEVVDSCAAKFKLYEKWDLDPNAPESRDLLKEEFYEEVSFSRSQYVSIIVSATTDDPQQSADMVNYMINLADGIRSRMYKKNLLIVYQSLEKEYNERKGYVNMLSDSVTALRGQTNIEVLTMMTNQVVLKTNNPSSSKEQTALERLINNYMFEQTRLYDLSERYNKAKIQYERPATHMFVLQYAKPSFKKRSPDYLTNILISVLCSIVFITGALLLNEKVKSLHLSE